MAREGISPVKKTKKATICNPLRDSNRSKKRANRNFKSLEQSSRKHRRAKNRSIDKLTQYGKLGTPGQKVQGGGDSFVHTCGGSIKYW